MNRRYEALLAQMLQELDAGKTLTAMEEASSQAAAMRGHLDTLDRLNAIATSSPDPRHVAAGRERMFSALSAKTEHRCHVSRLAVMSPLLRLTAAAAGIVVLTGAAAGVSVAVGGPPLWRTAGISRSADRAVERAGAGDTTSAKESESNSESGGEGSAVDAAATSPAGDDTATADGTGETQDDVNENGQGSESDRGDIAAEPDGEQEPSAAVDSSTTGIDDHGSEGDLGEEAATPR